MMNDFPANLRVKKAVILAGGQKTKLSPLDKYRPTWMLPVINRPLIEFTIDSLRNNGIEEVMIATSKNNEIPDKLKGYNSPDIKIHFHIEDEPRGTAGAIKDLEGFIGGETFVVINDSTFIEDINLSKAVEFHHKMRSAVTVGIYKDTISNKTLEHVEVAPDSKIRSFHIIHSSMDTKLPWTWRSSGMYIFDPVVLRFINKNGYMDIKEQLIPALQKESLNVSAFEIEGIYQCINSANDYIRVQRAVLTENGNHTFYPENMEEVAERVWAGKNVTISPKAYVLGPVVIGDGCTIKDWAQIIGPAVIGNGCQISQGVLIRESILWDGISLSGGTKIEHSIIGEGSTIPNNSYIKNMIVLNGLSVGDANLIPSDYSIKGTIDLSDAISATRQKTYKIVKRMMDIALSTIGTVLLSPLFLIIAAAIKIDSPGPACFKQKRCGKNGRLFKMIKFRTMVANAEVLHKELISLNEIDGPMFKITNDPRVTRLGRILRKTSFDELPQLLNVLKGEMSLVGPRPLIMDEMQFSPSWRDTRLKVLPGITGLWQIQGRSDASFHDWIRYDVFYVKNQSLWLDIKILFNTIKIVLKKVGAY